MKLGIRIFAAYLLVFVFCFSYPINWVLDNLRTALSGTTVLMVASRPSTISLADDVVFMAGGRVLAHGRHEELMATVPAYRHLVEAFESDRSAADGEQIPVRSGGGGR